MVLHSIILFLVFLKFVTSIIKDEHDQLEEKSAAIYYPHHPSTTTTPLTS